MLGLILQPHASSSSLELLVLRMGVAWYLPLAYACSSVLISALAHWAIGKGRLRYPVYCLALGYLLLIVAYDATLYQLWDLEQLTGPHAPLLVISIQISGLLLAVSLVVLNQRVMWTWFEE